MTFQALCLCGTHDAKHIASGTCEEVSFRTLSLSQHNFDIFLWQSFPWHFAKQSTFLSIIEYGSPYKYTEWKIRLHYFKV